MQPTRTGPQRKRPPFDTLRWPTGPNTRGQRSRQSIKVGRCSGLKTRWWCFGTQGMPQPASPAAINYHGPPDKRCAPAHRFVHRLRKSLMQVVTADRQPRPFERDQKETESAYQCTIRRLPIARRRLLLPTRRLPSHEFRSSCGPVEPSIQFQGLGSSPPWSSSPWHRDSFSAEEPVAPLCPSPSVRSFAVVRV